MYCEAGPQALNGIGLPSTRCVRLGALRIASSVIGLSVSARCRLESVVPPFPTHSGVARFSHSVVTSGLNKASMLLLLSDVSHPGGKLVS